jgi:diaminopimelate decarboxylase
MIKGTFPTEKFDALETPFYYYDIELLHQTLDVIKNETENKPYHIHYAIKANTNPRIMQEIAKYGFGADCVSGNEILRALECGFPAEKIVFAGVGKTDREIGIGLDNNILCFNVESLPELERIDFLATQKGKIANIALRINPNVDAHTHQYITTGLPENKFGLNEQDIPAALQIISQSTHLELIGLHFHIGSQITDLSSFENLCVRATEMQRWFNEQGIELKTINVGGGLGINYHHPNHCPVADFEAYFRVFDKYLKLQNGQTLHFELGRSLVASCGTLVSRVIYVKQGISKKFMIIDAGMTELIRPALYQAFHHIENISSDAEYTLYDVVGPVCESSDVFVKDMKLNKAKRDDFIAIRSAGAYGEVMVSHYNCREHPKSYFSDTV